MGLGNTRAGTEGSDRKEENNMSVENARRQLRDILDPDDFDVNPMTSTRRRVPPGELHDDGHDCSDRPGRSVSIARSRRPAGYVNPFIPFVPSNSPPVSSNQARPAAPPIGPADISSSSRDLYFAATPEAWPRGSSSQLWSLAARLAPWRRPFALAMRNIINGCSRRVGGSMR